MTAEEIESVRQEIEVQTNPLLVDDFCPCGAVIDYRGPLCADYPRCATIPGGDHKRPDISP